MEPGPPSATTCQLTGSVDHPRVCPEYGSRAAAQQALVLAASLWCPACPSRPTCDGGPLEGPRKPQVAPKRVGHQVTVVSPNGS
jgi:hypothetical protein